MYTSIRFLNCYWCLCLMVITIISILSSMSLFRMHVFALVSSVHAFSGLVAVGGTRHCYYKYNAIMNAQECRTLTATCMHIAWITVYTTMHVQYQEY